MLTPRLYPGGVPPQLTTGDHQAAFAALLERMGGPRSQGGQGSGQD